MFFYFQTKIYFCLCFTENSEAGAEENKSPSVYKVLTGSQDPTSISSSMLRSFHYTFYSIY